MEKTIKDFFRSYQGRHFFSRHARKFFELPALRFFLGLFLVLTVFSLGVVTPQTLAFMETQKAAVVSLENSPVETTTEMTFGAPLERFTLSQGFSWLHWGIDLTAEEGTPVRPIARGKVLEAGSSSWGYGNYLLVDHQNGQKSLYAHLSKLEVKKGDLVNKETSLGRVGHTGWATGNHLHLEIYQNGLPLNPLEVLPEK